MKNPFVAYLNSPNVEFIGKSPNFTTQGKPDIIKGKVANYTECEITLQSNGAFYTFTNFDHLKIVLKDINDLPNKQSDKITKLGFCLSYPKPYIRDEDAESRDFTVFEVAKLNQYLINEGVDIGIIPKKYVINE